MSIQRAAALEQAGFQPLTLTDIREAISRLFVRAPSIPLGAFRLQDRSGTTSAAESDPESQQSDPYLYHPRSEFNKPELRQWAIEMMSILDEYALLCACIGPSVYAWRASMSGEATQNYNFLVTEVILSQTQMSSQVRPLLQPILVPSVRLVTDQILESRNAKGETVRKVLYRTELDDPAYHELCYDTVGRNTVMLRQLLLSNLDRLLSVLRDFALHQHLDDSPDLHGTF